jgi:hypothetical protein
MDGEVISFDPDINRGDILGEDKRRYGFLRTEWHSAGEPERGNAVRFVANDDRATQVCLLVPAHASPLRPSEAIEAVYTIALGRAGDGDPFGAPVRWRSYPAPILVMLVLGGLQQHLRGDIPIDWSKLTFGLQLLVLGFLLMGMLVTLAVVLGVVALLGRLMGEPGRVGRGVLAYLWVEAVLVQPAICVMRIILVPRNPTIVIVLLALGLIAAVLGAGRVVRSGFLLGHTAAGVFVVIAAGLVGFILDRVG